MNVPRISLCLLVCLVAFSSAFAQVDTGTIAGSVRDSQGAGVPSASVTFVETSTNASMKTKTDGAGDFASASFAAGQLQGDRGSSRIQNSNPGHARRPCPR